MSSKTDWIKWNSNKLPGSGSIILAVIRNFRSGFKRYALLKRVKEDDVVFRNYDDDSEFAEMGWEILQYKILEKP